MPLPSNMQDLSTTAASNSPAGGDPVGTSLDNYLRAIQAIVRTTNAKGADIASAATTDIGAATGEFVTVTGTTTITSLGTIDAGIVRTVHFSGALTITHNATSLILPGAQNYTTVAGDVLAFRSLGSGNWRCVGVTRASSGLGTPIQVDTVAGMKALTGLSDGAKIVTTRYRTGGNLWGGGTYIYRAAPTGTEDGFIYHDQDTGGGQFELVDAFPNQYHAGAYGDGSTPDDSAFANIQAALTNGATNGFWVRSGNSLLTSATRVDLNNLPDKLWIKGDGESSVITFGSGSNARPFVIRNMTGVNVSGVYFKNTNSSVSCNCLDLMNVSDADIENNVFDGATFYGLGVFQDVIGATDAVCNNVFIRNNKFIDIGLIGFEQFPKVKSKTTEVCGNVFINCGHNTLGLGGTAAAMKPGQAYESASVHDNIIYSCPAIGIGVSNCESISVFDNQIYDPKSYAVAVTIADHPYPYTAEYKEVTVRDNKVVYRTGFSATNQTIVINGERVNNGPISIEQNRIYGGNQTAIIATPTNAMPNIRIMENKIYNNTSSLVIRLTNAVSGGAPASPVVDGNLIINSDLTKTTYRIELEGCSSPKVRANRLVNMGNNAMQLTSCTGTIVVEDNIIDGYNVANTASVAAINVTDSSANTYYIRRNKVLTNSGNPKSIYNGNNATPTVIMDGNTADSVSVTVTVNSTPTVSESGALPFVQYGKRRHFYGSAAPAAGGVYSIGDIVWNTATVAGGTPGWVCTTGGSPGTWKAMANVAV